MTPFLPYKLITGNLFTLISINKFLFLLLNKCILISFVRFTENKHEVFILFFKFWLRKRIIICWELDGRTSFNVVSETLERSNVYAHEILHLTLLSQSLSFCSHISIGKKLYITCSVQNYLHFFGKQLFFFLFYPKVVDFDNRMLQQQLSNKEDNDNSFNNCYTNIVNNINRLIWRLQWNNAGFAGN